MSVIPAAKESGAGRTRPSAWALSIAFSFIAVLLTEILRDPFAGAFYFILLAGTLLSALYGGLRRGFLSLGICVVASLTVLTQPRWSLARFGADEAWKLIGFILTSSGMIWVGARARDGVVSERLARERFEALAESERRSRSFFERLQEFTAACSAASSVAEVANVTLRSGLVHPGAASGAICTFADPTHLQISYSTGISEEELRALPAVPLDAPFPAAEVARTRQPVFIESSSEIGSKYPPLAEFSARSGLGSFTAFPLIIGQDLLGVLIFAFRGPRVLTDEERHYVSTLASHAAEALARARSFEAAQDAHREASRVSEFKERVMAVVGHDLRSPLASIKLNADMVTKRGELSPSQAIAVSRIHSAADRMNGIIGDLLDVARLRRGLIIPLVREELNVAEVIRGIVAELASPEGRPIDLQVTGSAQLRADRQRLGQVLANLLGNAIQHGQGPVSIVVRGEADVVIVRVHNSGPPIPADLLPHLFEPFKGSRQSGDKAPTSSIGLGLYIAKEIVQQHGGDISVVSTKDEGTSFTVTLPRGVPAV